MRRARTFLITLVMALVATTGVEAQETGNVGGTVVDATTGRPLADALVGTSLRSTVTRDDGGFLLTAVPAGTQTVRVQLIGYADESVEVEVRTGETVMIQIEMQVSALALEGIVVTGYGQSEARDLTGVIEAVDETGFNQGRVISAEQLIQGKIAGVEVFDSGEPGGGIQIRIRGGTSITSSNEPLFVVDGVPLAAGGGISAGRNPLNFLNPEDIVRITVLKDASATAIYGSRGANGVVMIETKDGRSTAGAEGSRLTYSGSVSGSTVVGGPEMLSAAQFREAVGVYAPNALTMLGSESTDWRRAVEQTGAGQQHNIAFASASEDFDYRLSLGYLTQDGVLRGTEAERATLALDYGQMFGDRFRVAANLKGSRSDDRFTPGGVVGGATAFAPTQPIHDPASPHGGYFEWYDHQQALNNPVAQLALSVDEGTTYRSIGDVEAKLQIPGLQGVTGTVRLGYDAIKTEREAFRPSFLREEAENDLAGFVSRANNTQLSTLLDAFVNGAHRFGGQDLEVDVTAGYAYGESRTDFAYFEAQGLSFDLLGTNGIPAAEQERSSIWVDESRLVSFFGRTNLSLRDRYLLTLSVRRDGSSKFGPEEQWGVFPSAAFAWRITEEPFMQDVDALGELKLRASWGKNGNQAFANYQQYPAYEIGEATAQYQFGDEFVTTIRPGAADRGIKWEETTSWNVGVDFGLAAGRVAGSMDYYFKRTEDLIFNVPVAAGTFTSNFITTNIGTVENRGFELGLDAILVDGRDGAFSWRAGLNAATNDNEIVQINPFGGGEVILTGGIAGGVGNLIQVLQPGHPVNSFYVYRHVRGADGRPIFEDRDGNGTINDLDLYEDTNGDGQVDSDDRVPFHSPAPDWSLGMSSSVAWRNLDAGLSMRALLGNYVYNNVASNYGHYRALSYVGPPNNLHRSVLETGFESEQYFSDYYVEDGSFLRVDNLTVGYTLDPLRGGQQVRLYGTVQNLLTLTGYSGVDPAAGVGGIDNNLYPRSRTFLAGATVTF